MPTPNSKVSVTPTPEGIRFESPGGSYLLPVKGAVKGWRFFPPDHAVVSLQSRWHGEDVYLLNLKTSRHNLLKKGAVYGVVGNISDVVRG